MWGHGITYQNSSSHFHHCGNLGRCLILHLSWFKPLIIIKVDYTVGGGFSTNGALTDSTVRFVISVIFKAVSEKAITTPCYRTQPGASKNISSRIKIKGNQILLVKVRASVL
jgi:hypothetical protein